MLGNKMRSSLLLGAFFALTTGPAFGASINLVDTDSAITGTNSSPNDFTLTNQGTGNRDGIYSYSYDAGAAFDMLVVSVSRESSSTSQNIADFPGTNGLFEVYYDGVEMSKATGAATGSGASIFYLETTAQSGEIALDFTSFRTVNGIGLGIAAIESDNGDPIFLTDADSTSGTSVTIAPLLDDSFSMFAIDTNGGAFTGLNASPLSQIYAATDVGSNGAGAATDLGVAAGSITYSYSNTVNPRGIAAANFAVIPEPGTFVILASGLLGVMLLKSRK